MKTLEIEGKTVEFGEKNFMQGNDCLWSECPVGVSTQEARYGAASIRCCEDEACMKWAAKFAIMCAASFPIAQA